jgi:hypothetical protein
MVAGRGEVNLDPGPSRGHIRRARTRRPEMQTRNRFMEDVSQLMTNAMGVAQG